MNGSMVDYSEVDEDYDDEDDEYLGGHDGPVDLLPLLQRAQEHLKKCVELLQVYVDETGDSYTEHYLLAHLKIRAGGDHEYLASDQNFDELIQKLETGDY